MTGSLSQSSRTRIPIPASTSTVSVRVLNTGTRLFLKSGLFWEPQIEGFPGVHSPIFCFLISNGNRHAVFDLGVRTDWENYAPHIVDLIKATTKITNCQKDVASILDEDSSSLGIRSQDIEAIIWSHTHFDHAGDPSRFPSSTRLVIGPGLTRKFWPGYPSNPDAVVLDSDIEGREVIEVDFKSFPIKVGGFDAFDYFGDGSFYLLDAPGHAEGHMCALARTTSDPPTFLFMGADACHHAGILRPSPDLSIPDLSSEISQKIDHIYGGCPGHLLEKLSTWKANPAEPFFNVPQGPIFSDHKSAMETVSKIQEMDSQENIFVVLAHDHSLEESLKAFPEVTNDWLAAGLKDATRWRFCNDFQNICR